MQWTIVWDDAWSVTGSDSIVELIERAPWFLGNSLFWEDSRFISGLGIRTSLSGD